MRFAPIVFAPMLLAAACSAPPQPATLTLAQLQAMQVPNVALPAPNLVTAGQPTEAQLAQLAQLGVTRVVCLRPATEPGTGWEEAKAKALGIAFVRLPIAGSDGITIDNARRLALELRGDAPTLLCCARSNRVGALLALKANHVDGRSAAEALAFGKAAGLAGLEPTVAAQLK